MKATILIGDARNRLSELADGSARTCVTSPPYFGLRDYGTGEWEGGNDECDHVAPPTGGPSTKRQRGKYSADGQYRDICKKCGANRIDEQIGIELTPEDYVRELVLLFREVRRVLADNGTVWLNLGDSFGKGKQLVGVPWRVAFALQADGWYLRQDIIWAKPNSMPESVTDRCTKSHEYVFLLSKSPKYYYNNEAIKEGTVSEGAGKRNKRDVWTINTKPFKGAHFAVMPEALVEPCVLAGSAEGDTVLDPFTGSGTVAVVALRHGRNFVGTELNPEYGEVARERITSSAPMFNEVEVK